MKNLISLLSLLVLFACKSKEPDQKEDFQYEETKTPAQLGQELFEGKGNCIACHNPEQKIIGPSLIEIATIYKAKKGNIVAFLREEAGPIVDPAQYEAMKTNFTITKAMSDEELKALEAYIMGHAK